MQILSFIKDENTFLRKLLTFSLINKQKLFNVYPKIFDRLKNKEDLNQYLLPYFFSIFWSPTNPKLREQNINWLLLPDINNNYRLEQHVYSNAEGIIKLEEDRFFKTDQYNQELIYNNCKSSFFLKNYSIVKSYQVNEIYIPNTSIRLYQYTPEYLLAKKGLTLIESIELTFKNNYKLFFTAIKFLQEHVPELYIYIDITTKEVCLFNSMKENSFATIESFGTIFINLLGKKGSLSYFIEDIAHQSGHLIFYVITYSKMENFFKLPSKSSINFATNGKYKSSRSLYGAYHGLFTYTSVLFALDRYMEELLITSAQEKMEVIGRIVFYLRKFGSDLLIFEEDILTEEGQKYFVMLKNSFATVASKYKDYIYKFSFEKQTYNFDFDIFYSENKSFLNKVMY